MFAFSKSLIITVIMCSKIVITVLKKMTGFLVQTTTNRYT